jgi:PAS domain-containing protein
VKRVSIGVDEDDFGVLDRGTAQDDLIGYGGPVAGVDADVVDLDRALGGRELRVTTETKRIFGRLTGLERRAENAGVGTDRQGVAVRSLIESNIDAIMTTDPAGVITDVNRQMEALTDCTRDELIGAPFKNYFTDPDRAEAAESLQPRRVLYTTGNAATDILRGAVGEACLIKPYQYDDLLRALEIVAGLVSTGAAVPPFPRGFQLLRTVSAKAPWDSRR